MDSALLITIVILGFASIANVLLGLAVLLRNTRKGLHQAFFALTIAAALWALTNLLFAVIDDAGLQYTAALMSYAAAGGLALFFLLYCAGLAGIVLRRLPLVAVWGIGGFFTAASLIPGYMATSVEDDRIMTNPLPLLLYGGYLLVFMLTGIAILLRARGRLKGADRDRIAIVIAGLGVAAIVGLFFNLVLPMLGNYDYVNIGPVATFILAGSSTYAIVRHRLFDVKLAAVRTLAYVGALLTLSGVYCIVAYIVSSTVFTGHMSAAISVNPANILITLFLAFLFQPIKRFFDKITDTIFYRDNYKTDEFIAELSRLLVSTTDLRSLLERASHQIALTFKTDQAFFFVYYSHVADRYVSAGTLRHAKLPLYDAHVLDQYFLENAKAMIITDLLGEKTQVRRMLMTHRVGAVVPLTQGDDTTGYLLLGEHLSGSYTKRDLAVLSTISNELVIAIQNAMSLHELQELNATLQQRIDVATKELRSSNAQLKHLDEVKDEFISMASHQLRTPLTSVKGYISMMLEGDVGKLTLQQEKVLSEAFNSSERMVRLIADFLNVSRLQTGKFVVEKADIDVKRLIEQEVANLGIMAKSRNMSLELHVPAGDVRLHADEAKVREVVMNFIDNAIYYSRPQSAITITLKKQSDSVEFTVRDHGIGVPAADQARLFHKFFRASNARRARPDGTGVGLYLARRVISAHGGKMVFRSVEGKGSTFGFELPLPATRSDQ